MRTIVPAVFLTVGNILAQSCQIQNTRKKGKEKKKLNDKNPHKKKSYPRRIIRRLQVAIVSLLLLLARQYGWPCERLVTWNCIVSFVRCMQRNSIPNKIKNVLYTEFRISHVSYNIDNEERKMLKKKKKEKLDFKKTPCWEKESKQFSIQEWQKCNLAVVPSIMRKWKYVVDTYIYVYRVFHLKSSLKLFIFFLKNVSNENYFIY